MNKTSNYSLSDLTPQLLRQIFESAQYDCEYLGDDDPVGIHVRDLSGICVRAHEEANLISFYCDKFSRKGVDAARTFCCSVNDNCHVVRAVSAIDHDDENVIMITLEYDFLLYPEDSISAKKVIKIAREVSGYMIYAIKECDSESIFKRS